MRQTIQTVVDDHLCNNCGTCAGICPQNAISLSLDKNFQIYKPEIQSDTCNECGFCYTVCPGHSVDFKNLNKEIFGKESEDIILGNYFNCYIGHSLESGIRYNAASGGVITGLLIYALEQGIIDGALVTRMNKDRPLEPEPFIARTRGEIIEASASKYCPVPSNILLREILNSENDEKFAVVGLPCHIHGIRKAESLNNKLKEKIILHIGLFCSHNDTFWQTDYILKSLNISREEVKSIRYRGEGWPGKLSVILKDGQNLSIPFRRAIFPHIVWFNSMNRCLYCCDLTAELADISVGDPWIPDILKVERIGKSIVMVRTDFGSNLLYSAGKEGYLRTTPIHAEDVNTSVSMGVTKKIDVQVRLFARRLAGKSIPIYNTRLLKPRFINYIRGLIPLIISTWSSNVHFRPFSEKLLDIGIWLSEISEKRR